MNAHLQALYSLQEVDIEIRQLQRKLQELDPGRVEEAALQAAQTQFQKVNSVTTMTERDLRDAELELQTVETKKKDTEKRLYSGSIRNPKELDSMQHEIDALGRQRSSLDEKILTLMDTFEEHRKAQLEAKQALEQAELTYQARKKLYQATRNRYENELTQLAQHRQELASDIEDSWLKRYDIWRKQHAGVALSRVVKGDCEACRTSLPLTLVERITKTDAVAFCENCGRVLVSGLNE